MQVRSLSGVRSELLATVVAFDKHWNLVLVDVDELYMRPKARRVFRQGRHEGFFTFCNSVSFHVIDTVAGI